MPSNFVFFWRDNATRKALVAFDTIDKLIAAKPLQVIVFNDTDLIMAGIEDGEQTNTSDDSGYTPGADQIVEKQYSGHFPRVVTLTIVSDTGKNAERTKIRQFARKVQIEPAYHQYGIFGIFHPKVADFTIDPDNNFGLTMDRPLHKYISGSEAVLTTITLRMGGKVQNWP